MQLYAPPPTAHQHLPPNTSTFKVERFILDQSRPLCVQITQLHWRPIPEGGGTAAQWSRSSGECLMKNLSFNTHWHNYRGGRTFIRLFQAGVILRPRPCPLHHRSSSITSGMLVQRQRLYMCSWTHLMEKLCKTGGCDLVSSRTGRHVITTQCGTTIQYHILLKKL